MKFTTHTFTSSYARNLNNLFSILMIIIFFVIIINIIIIIIIIFIIIIIDVSTYLYCYWVGSNVAYCKAIDESVRQSLFHLSPLIG